MRDEELIVESTEPQLQRELPRELNNLQDAITRNEEAFDALLRRLEPILVQVKMVKDAPSEVSDACYSEIGNELKDMSARIHSTTQRLYYILDILTI